MIHNHDDNTVDITTNVYYYISSLVIFDSFSPAKLQTSGHLP